jgi:hypothetical protein
VLDLAGILLACGDARPVVTRLFADNPDVFFRSIIIGRPELFAAQTLAATGQRPGSALYFQQFAMTMTAA